MTNVNISRLFFVHSHFLPLYTLPFISLLFPYLSPPMSSLPFLKEVNKKLSYRRQNALTIKPSANILFLCARLDCS